MVNTEKILDVEWIALILEAKEIGLSKEEILTFLRKSSKKG
ncbi:anti-repressor SinI family protein [Bacillus sp. PS06]|nr:anti-repressor SinI family protein [Bacillus sp. PS06]